MKNITFLGPDGTCMHLGGAVNLKLNKAFLIQSLFYLLCCAFILAPQKTHSQNLPPATDCVANDFEIRGAQLTGIPNCFECDGDTYPANLELTLFNKTGSLRTSFAFWATLETTQPDGTVTTEQISSCGGPVEGNTPAVTFDGLIDYECGTTLRIVDIYMAWTSASPNETCPLDPATIAPNVQL